MPLKQGSFWSVGPAFRRKKRIRGVPSGDALTSQVKYARLRNRKGECMTLSFPNSSRSYDATRRAVRFWGYDNAMEASFFVTEDALKRVQPGMTFDQSGALGAFDVNRPLIYAAAAKVYARGHKGSYDLVSSDF
jgi:hypothetical protein